MHPSPDAPSQLAALASKGDALRTRFSLLAGIGSADAAGAWDRFFRTYQGYIIHQARSQSLDEADAQDVLQLVMLVVAREACGFHYDPDSRIFRTAGVTREDGQAHEFARFRSWLKGLVQIKIWEVRRLRRRGGPLQREETACDIPDESASPAEAAEAASEQAHRQALLREAMRQLRDSYRGSPRNLQVFEAIFLREESLSTVAASHSISTNYAGVIVHTLKERLRETLTGLLHDAAA